MASKLSAHGFKFCNWPGPGEEAAEAFGLTHAIIVPPNTKTIIVGGQIGIKDDGSISEDVEEQVTEAFEHVKQALQAAGLGEDAWEYVYKVSLSQTPVLSILQFRACYCFVFHHC